MTENGVGQICIRHVSALEVCTLKGGTSEVCSHEIRGVQKRAGKIPTDQAASGSVHAIEEGILHVLGTIDAYVTEDGTAKVGLEEVGTPQRGTADVRPSEIGVHQIGAFQISGR